MRGFCEKKFVSMLISGTFTKAVMYLMLLSDSIIAGFFIGETGVAAINAIAPITAIVTFFGDLGSTGVGIVFAREVGAMRKHRADEIYGQGLIISIGVGLISALLILAMRDIYFGMSGITGDILDKALQYYQFASLNAFLTIVIFYLEQMVYSDGDELCNSICYGFQIGGNIICSIILASFLGMTGIILGSVVGNALGILTCLWHYFRKVNTLHFVWHLSLKDFLLTSRYSIVDSSVYICWGLMDYMMIGFVTSHYGESSLTTLAVVVSLIEFAVVMDGVGMALQPLIGTYVGEGNHRLIRRVMKSGVKAAVVEGLIATLFIWIFAEQFCALFGITGGPTLLPTTTALRIVSLGFTFCSLVSLTTSYYMLTDHIRMATCIACLHNGLFYTLLPMLGSLAFSINGMWAGFAAAPILALACAYLFVYLRFGKDNFPFLLKHMDTEIEVLDDTLTQQTVAELSERVGSILLAHGYSNKTILRASLFIEEMGLSILNANKDAKKPVLIELSLLFDSDSVLIIERDSGKLFDIVNLDQETQSINRAVLDAILSSLNEKVYLVTTGYNRHMVRFTQD